MRAENTVRALRMAVNIRGVNDYQKKMIHHSDHGSQYASNIYTELLENFGIRISMCYSVYENIHIERVNGTIKNQYLKRWHIKTQRELYKKLNETVWAYNNDRPHESLKKMTPVEFENFVKELKIDQKPVLGPLFTDKRNSDKTNTNQLVLDL